LRNRFRSQPTHRQPSRCRIEFPQFRLDIASDPLGAHGGIGTADFPGDCADHFRNRVSVRQVIARTAETSSRNFR